jgi:hypothetical protein
LLVLHTVHVVLNWVQVEAVLLVLHFSDFMSPQHHSYHTTLSSRNNSTPTSGGPEARLGLLSLFLLTVEVRESFVRIISRVGGLVLRGGMVRLDHRGSLIPYAVDVMLHGSKVDEIGGNL